MQTIPLHSLSIAFSLNLSPILFQPFFCLFVPLNFCLSFFCFRIFLSLSCNDINFRISLCLFFLCVYSFFISFPFSLYFNFLLLCLFNSCFCTLFCTCVRLATHPPPIYLNFNILFPFIVIPRIFDLFIKTFNNFRNCSSSNYRVWI